MKEDKELRLRAIAAGEFRYKSVRICKRNPVHSIRKIDGSCHECQQEDYAAKHGISLEDLEEYQARKFDNGLKRGLARAAGKRFYRTTLQCQSGHNCPRYVKNGACIECTRILRERKKRMKAIGA